MHTLSEQELAAIKVANAELHTGWQCVAAVYQHLVECALQDRRCPTSEQLEYLFPALGSRNAIPPLARAGLIRSEVTSRNYRTVYICLGAHAGARTNRPPTHGRPYMVLGPARPSNAA